MSATRSTDRDERPLGELFADVTAKLQSLVRKEMELARVETKEQLGQLTKGASAFGAAAAVAFIAGILLAFAAAWGLAEVIPTGFAFLAVGVVFLAVAGVLFSRGRSRMAGVSPVPQRTMQTVKQDVETAKESLQRGASGPATYPDPWRSS